MLLVVLLFGFVLLSLIILNFPISLGQNETTFVQRPGFNNTNSTGNSANNSSEQILTYTDPSYHFNQDNPFYLKPDETNLY